MNKPFCTEYNDQPKEVSILPMYDGLLLPRGKMPLEIFEQRYINLILDSLGKGRFIGIIQYEQNIEGNLSQRLYNVGCLGRITSFRESNEETLSITLSGICRFRVNKELDMHSGYRRVEADYSPYKDDLKTEDVSFDRNRLLCAFEQYTDYYNLRVRKRLVEKLPNPILLSTLSMMLPFKSCEKQALLECKTTEELFNSLVAILEMGTIFTNTTPDKLC